MHRSWRGCYDDVWMKVKASYLCAAAVHRSVRARVPGRRGRGIRIRISFAQEHFSSTNRRNYWLDSSSSGPNPSLRDVAVALSRFINLVSDTQLRELLFIVRVNFMNETGRTIPRFGSCSKRHAKKKEFSVRVLYELLFFHPYPTKMPIGTDVTVVKLRALNRWRTPERTKRGACHIFIHKILMDPDMHKDMH